MSTPSTKEDAILAVKRSEYALRLLSPELKADRDVVLSAVVRYGAALQYAAPLLRADRKVVLAAVTQEGRALQYAAPVLRADREVVLAAIHSDHFCMRSPLCYAAPEFKSNRGVVLAAVAQHGDALKYAAPEFQADREVVLAAMQSPRCGISNPLEYAAPEFRSDLEVVLAAVAQKGEALRLAAPELRRNRDVVYAAVTQDGNVLRDAEPEFQADREVVLAAVSGWTKFGVCPLKYAAPELRSDWEVVFTAVAQNTDALRHATLELQADRKVVLFAVTQEGRCLQYAAVELRGDREVVLAAVSQDGNALQYATAELRADREIVLAAVAVTGYALQYAAPELKADREVVRFAASNGALNYAALELQADRDFLLATVSAQPHTLPSELKADRDFVLAAVARSGAALRYAAPELQADREVVATAVSQCGFALGSAAPEFQVDRAIVLATLQTLTDQSNGNVIRVHALKTQLGRANRRHVVDMELKNRELAQVSTRLAAADDALTRLESDLLTTTQTLEETREQLKEANAKLAMLEPTAGLYAEKFIVCRDFLAVYLSKEAAERRAIRELADVVTDADFDAVMAKLSNEFNPPIPRPPGVIRAGKRILVIAPGFGFLANPQQLRCLKAGGFTVIPCFASNPEEPGFRMDEGIKKVLGAIAAEHPDAILAASKGGAYLVELWHKHNITLPSLMINAHPHCFTHGLPKNTKVIVVQGSEEEVWPRPRGYDGVGPPTDGSLEAMIRTGSPGMCYLHYTLSKNGVRARVGDGHNAASLLRDDCLSRLIDSLLSEWPAFHFATTSACFLAPERLEAERFLGFEPRSLRRFWASTDRKGMDDDRRFVVVDGSDEFNAVRAIFSEAPAVRSHYCPGVDMKAMDIVQIERVENGSLHESMDSKYGNFNSLLNKIGAGFVGGVHTRWLFHGAGSPEAVSDIINDPIDGFNSLLNERGLWGKGLYFARDSAYSYKCPGCCDTCIDDKGHMMVMLCLVSTGIPCVGEEGMKICPKIHPDLIPQTRYASFVDDAANPEIFVVGRGDAVYPAYVIHFS